MTDPHALINGYRANLPDAHWAAIAPVVRELAHSYASKKNYEAVRVGLIALAGFADWVYCTAAAPLTPGILRRDLIDAYEAVRRSEVLPTIAAKDRKRLLDIAGEPRTWEVGRAHGAQGYALASIYKEWELEVVRDWARWQPNRISRISANGLVGLALGCGLRRNELVYIHRKHVRGEGNALTVSVPGPRARLVQADPQWADELNHSFTNTSGYLIAPRSTARSSKKLAGYFSRAHGELPLPTLMRNTWLLNRVNESHSAPEILRMSGLTSLRSIEDLVRTHAPHRKSLLQGARSER